MNPLGAVSLFRIVLRVSANELFWVFKARCSVGPSSSHRTHGWRAHCRSHPTLLMTILLLSVDCPHGIVGISTLPIHFLLFPLHTFKLWKFFLLFILYLLYSQTQLFSKQFLILVCLWQEVSLRVFLPSHPQSIKGYTCLLKPGISLFSSHENHRWHLLLT